MKDRKLQDAARENKPWVKNWISDVGERSGDGPDLISEDLYFFWIYSKVSWHKLIIFTGFGQKYSTKKPALSQPCLFTAINLFHSLHF